MQCPKCKSEILDSSKFCPECGSNISVISAISSAEKELSIGAYKTVSAPVPEIDKSVGGIRTVSSKESVTPGSDSSVRIIKDRYELQEEIGRGGFSVVYKGIDKKLNRIIAVKVLSPQAGIGNTSVERFQRESSIIASLNHHNILAVYDCGHETDIGYFILMECIEGGTLRDYLKEKGKLAIQDAVSLMRGLCKGMSYAHRKNLIHRDLKPANIMLTSDGEELVPKIVDFGLARAGGTSEVSISGFGMGTPFYMPPEQRRDAKSVNHTADIYALGKVFYEMLTGDIPDNVDPDKIPAESSGLSQIIFRCVKTKPEERYFSVDDLLADIDKFMSSTGKKSSIQKEPVTGVNVCPQCSTSNKSEAKFCAKCGTGLTRQCPECDAESSIHVGCCPYCENDIELFRSISGVLQKMEQYFQEKKWSRVVKERTLLAKEIILSGEKGTELIGKINNLNWDAENKQKKINALYDKIPSLTKVNDFSSALVLLDKLLGITEDTSSIEELKLSVLRDELIYRNDHYLKKIDSGLYQEALREGKRILEIIPQLKGEKIEGIREIEESVGGLEQKMNLLGEIGRLAKKKYFGAALELIEQFETIGSGGINVEELKASVLRDEMVYRNDIYLKNIDSGLYQEALCDGKRILEIIPQLKGEKTDGIKEIEQSISGLERKLKLLADAGQAVKSIWFFNAYKLIKELGKYPEFKKEAIRLQRGNLLKIYVMLFVCCLIIFFVSLYFYNHYQNKQLFNSHIMAGQRAMEENRFEDAETALKKALKIKGYGKNSLAVSVIQKLKDKILDIQNLTLQKNKTEYEDFMSQGQNALDAKNFEEAEVAFKKALTVPGYAQDNFAASSLQKTQDNIKADIQNREIQKNKSEYDNLMNQGQKALVTNNIEAAEKAFKRALSVSGYTQDPLAASWLLETQDNIEKAKNNIEYGKAIEEGKKAASGEKWMEAESAFKRALSLKGYENDSSAQDGLKAAQKEMELKKNKDNVKVAFEEAAKKVTQTFLPVIQDETKSSVERLNASDDALALLNYTEKSYKIYLSAVDQSELSSLKSKISSLQSKPVQIPTGFEMVKEPAADTKWLPQEIKHKVTGIEMVYVAPGEFIMGSPTNEANRINGEIQHKVTLTKGYYIGKYEVTQKQYEKVMGSNPSYFKESGKDAPVETVSWDDCQAFCRKLGSGFRLPTEAEWEYAARGGNRSKGYIYSGSNNLYEVAWHDKNSGNKTQSVGQKKANELGIYDMSGNVWEWCSDWYGDYYPWSVTDPKGASFVTSGQVLRGGSWSCDDRCCRTAYRGRLDPGCRNDEYGIRVVFSVF